MMMMSMIKVLQCITACSVHCNGIDLQQNIEKNTCGFVILCMINNNESGSVLTNALAFHLNIEFQLRSNTILILTEEKRTTGEYHCSCIAHMILLHVT